MLTLAEWFARCEGRQRDWLVLGKGPSFRCRTQYDLTPFLTLSLNHAVRELPVTAAHLIDIDVFESCADAIDRNARFLLMPFRPHVNNRPGAWTLPRYITHHSVLGKLEREGRLVGYHLSTAGMRSSNGTPVIQVKYFSAEAALRILALCGARRVRSLGIDGGSAYSEEFSDLRSTTLLSNGRRSFNEQFQEVASILHATGVDYAPLNVESPIRVYIGTTASQELAFQVLAYSIQRHASMTTQIIPMRDLPLPLPQEPGWRARTPFSFSRFLVPQLAGYRGKAVYVDADMLVFQDMARLWAMPLQGADLMYVQQPSEFGRPTQCSVLLMNCAALHWNLQEILDGLRTNAYSYEDLMHRFCLVPPERRAPAIPPCWNSLERFERGVTALLHYTDMPRQPWVSLDNRWGSLWIDELLRAIREHQIDAQTVEAEVALGHVRPSLLAQVREGTSRGAWRFHWMDRGFVPPYRQCVTVTRRRPFVTLSRAHVS